ncbi:MAG: transporter substrate-binding domain-containing protein [Alphaproteobacteria bacterium]
MVMRRWGRGVGLVTLLLAFLSAAVAASAATTPEIVKSRGKLLVGVKYDTPPFGFVDKDGQVAGFDVDILREVAGVLGVGIDFVKVTSQTRIPLLVSGNVDLVAASMTHTREREKAIDFSITYYTGAQALLVPEGSKITGLADLAEKTVAVQQGTTLERNLAQLAPKATVLPFRDYTSAWLAVRQGRADALTGSYDIMRGFIATAQGDKAQADKGFKIVGPRFSVEPFGIGVRRGDADMRNVVNAVLQDLWTSGRYRELYVKWFKIDPGIPIEMWPKE